MLWLFLKYIPLGFKVISEATKNFADSYKTMQEARLVSQNRKRLQEEMKRDAYLQKLSNRKLNQLIVLWRAWKRTNVEHSLRRQGSLRST
jgi:hypothetical protein